MSKAKGSGKDRSSKTTASPNQMKTEGLPNNIKATPEQIRLAQITSGDDSQEIEEKIQELMVMTSKSKDECALALHDCVNDVSNAAMLLIEGSGEPGEWKMGGKKKKRQAMQTQLPSKPDFNDHHEAPDSSRDRSRDMEAGDRGDRDFQPRRGRRNNGGPPPRLSRGRGRDRGNVGERQTEDGEDRENGVGLTRNGDRGRGRGRGGQPRRGRGGSRTFRGQGQRFEKEPHIDTWTNETADKVPDGWCQTWMDDVGDDSWAGSLNETKVFTASAAKSEESTTAASPTTPEPPTPGQRLDLGRLLPKLNNDSGNSESYINQYNAQATESIKNSIGIGSDSSRQHYPSHPATAPNLLNSVTSISMATTTQTNSWAAATAGAVGTPTPTPSQPSSQHRPKPLKSKLPPPSKIPQSAVEMPGHQNIPPLDIHFGLDDDPNSFGFTMPDTVGTTTSFATSATTSTTMASSNHSAEMAPVAMPVISTPSSQPTTPQEQPPRSVFQSSGFSKKEGQSTLAPSARMSPSADMSFTPPEQKTTSMLPSQLSSQTSSHSQGPVSSANEAVSSLASYAQQSTGSYNMSSYKSNPATQSYSSTHTTNSQVGSYQYQPSPKSYGGSSQNQYQSGPSQYQSSQGQASQYPNSQYPSSGQNQYGYQSSSVGSFQSNNAGSLYQNPTPASSFQQASASYHTRDSQAGSSQPGSGFQSQNAGLASPTSQAQGSYSGPAFSSASHQSSLSSSSMTTNKLGDSMSKMSLKESAMDTHSNAQFEHSSTSTTSAGSTTSTGALATGTTTVAVSTVSPAAAASSSNSSRGASNLSSSASTKVPPNLPPGVPLAGMGAAGQFFMGNHPAIYQGVQQPMFGYDEMILQGRLPMAGNYYDLSQFQVPTTMPGRDAPTLASYTARPVAPFMCRPPPYYPQPHHSESPTNGSADSNKLARVDAQSPNPTSQSGHNPQQGSMMPFYFYPPQVLPGTAPGFPQYPQMFPEMMYMQAMHARAMPPVTNTAATATSQFPQKNYGYSNKGSTGSGDLGATGYGKTHPQQAFDKQGFHGNTPPPFNMPPLAAASQATPMGAPSNAYQFMPVMAHQTHTPMAMHHQIQDSTPGSSRMGGGQGSSVGKAKAYGNYWNN